jgi:hypothetical protein
MAIGPRKYGRRKHRLVAKPRRPRASSSVAGGGPWTPAAYRARETQERPVQGERLNVSEPLPTSEAPILESAWTLSAFAQREALRQAQALADRGPPQESEWTPAAYGAREALRHGREIDGDQPVQESDWTLAAYAERSASLPGASETTATATRAVERPTAPEVRIDFRPARFEPAAAQKSRFPARAMIYAAGAAAVLVGGVSLWRAGTPSGDGSPRKVEAIRRVAPAPATAPDVESAPTAVPAPPPPPEPDKPAAAGAGAPSNPAPVVEPEAAAQTPPAAPRPALVAPDAASPSKTESAPKLPGPPAAAPGRPGEGRPSASGKKTHGAEPHPKPARDSRREARAPASWLDQVVNSVKRFGRALTP